MPPIFMQAHKPLAKGDMNSGVRLSMQDNADSTTLEITWVTRTDAVGTTSRYRELAVIHCVESRGHRSSLEGLSATRCEGTGQVRDASFRLGSNVASLAGQHVSRLTSAVRPRLLSARRSSCLHMP
eukprot:scaffold98683_cov33-Tisochrysis_lutea.AAC.1